VSELIARHGAEPGQWLPHFYTQVLGGSA